MSLAQLPDRPDIDQLRRQARELQRAAALDGDAGARRRLRAVSGRVRHAGPGSEGETRHVPASRPS